MDSSLLHEKSNLKLSVLVFQKHDFYPLKQIFVYQIVFKIFLSVDWYI